MNPITNYEIIGYIVAIIAALAVFIAERSKDKCKKATPTLIALTIVFLGVILTTVMSLRYDVAVRNEEKLERLTSIQDASKFVESIVEAEANVKNSQNRFFELIFLARKKEFLKLLQDATNGTFVVRKEEIGSFSNDLISSAKKSIIATSYVSTRRWWETEWGKAYLKLNYDLIKQGVRIKRFFICSDETELESNRPLITDQVRNGVDVRIVFTKELEYQYTKDLIIVDDLIGGRLELTIERDIVQATMCTSKDGIEEIRADFNNLSVKSNIAKEYFSSH